MAEAKALLAALQAAWADVMVKQIDALARQLLTLMQDGQQLKAEQKESRQDLRALIDMVRQLKYNQQRERDPRAGEVVVAS